MSTPDILPVCTTRSKRGGLSIRGVWCVPIHCMFCGKHNGYCNESATDPGGGYVGYCCDDCASIPRNSDLVGLSLIPDEVHWQRVREAQLEEHGKLLTLDELAVALDDVNSPMSVLARGL